MSSFFANTLRAWNPRDRHRSPHSRRVALFERENWTDLELSWVISARGFEIDPPFWVPELAPKPRLTMRTSDQGRPLRMLYANRELDEANCIHLLLEWATKRQWTLGIYEDLVDLAADARETPCALFFVSCSSGVIDSQRPAGTHWHDLLPGVARLKREFQKPIICTCYRWGAGFPARVAEAGARLMQLPVWLHDFESFVPPELRSPISSAANVKPPHW